MGILSKRYYALEAAAIASAAAANVLETPSDDRPNVLGSGILSSYFSINHNGTAQEIPYANRITGRYAINSDLATGYLQFPPTDALKLGSTMSFVLTNGGNEMFLLSMEPSWPRSLDEAIEPLAGICFYGIAKRG